ncbi:MAG: glutamate--tRNA ligase, partial [bacterium]
MSLEEIIAAFSLDRVSKKSAVFDTKKLEWLNMQYFKRRSPDEIAKMALPYFKEFGISPDAVDPSRLEEVVKLLGERFRTLLELADKAHYFFTDAPKIDPKAFRKHIQKENAAAILEEVIARLEPLKEFDQESIEREIRAVIAARGVKPGEVIQPVRVAISGRMETPGIFETMALVGKEKALDRMKKAPHMTVGDAGSDGTQ